MHTKTPLSIPSVNHCFVLHWLLVPFPLKYLPNSILWTSFLVKHDLGILYPFALLDFSVFFRISGIVADPSTANNKELVLDFWGSTTFWSSSGISYMLNINLKKLKERNIKPSYDKTRSSYPCTEVVSRVPNLKV